MKHKHNKEEANIGGSGFSVSPPDDSYKGGIVL